MHNRKENNMSKLSGGGYTSNKLVRETVVGGSRSTQPVNPRGLSQYGTAQGGMLNQSGSFTGRNSAQPVFEAKKPNPVPFGNDLVNNVGQGGPGTGRTTYHAGSQASTPAASNPQGGRDILSGFGPEPSDRSPLVRK
jgi:hypothetical protein